LSWKDSRTVHALAFSEDQSLYPLAASETVHTTGAYLSSAGERDSLPTKATLLVRQRMLGEAAVLAYRDCYLAIAMSALVPLTMTRFLRTSPRLATLAPLVPANCRRSQGGSHLPLPTLGTAMNLAVSVARSIPSLAGGQYEVRRPTQDCCAAEASVGALLVSARQNVGRSTTPCPAGMSTQ
jgi:hypothetical protein